MSAERYDPSDKCMRLLRAKFKRAQLYEEKRKHKRRIAFFSYVEEDKRLYERRLNP